MAAAAVRTHQQSRVESSHKSLAESRVLMPHVLFSSVRLLVIGRDGCYLEEEMDVEKLILLVKDYEETLDASRCEHRNRDYVASVWQKIAQEMGVGKTSATMFYFLI